MLSTLKTMLSGLFFNNKKDVLVAKLKLELEKISALRQQREAIEERLRRGAEDERDELKADLRNAIELGTLYQVYIKALKMGHPGTYTWGSFEIMKDNIERGKFTVDYYINLWTERLLEMEKVMDVTSNSSKWKKKDDKWVLNKFPVQHITFGPAIWDSASKAVMTVWFEYDGRMHRGRKCGHCAEIHIQEWCDCVDHHYHGGWETLVHGGWETVVDEEVCVALEEAVVVSLLD